jgi:hypothetical protein
MALSLSELPCSPMDLGSMSDAHSIRLAFELLVAPMIGWAQSGVRAAYAAGREVQRQLPQIAAHASLAALKDLPPDWNGYGAAPIDTEIIASASMFINDLGAEFPSAPVVVPMTKGRLQFEWHQGNRSLEIEFEKPQTIHYLKWDSGLGIEDEDIIDTMNERAISGLFEWFSSEKRDADSVGRRTASS